MIIRKPISKLSSKETRLGVEAKKKTKNEGREAQAVALKKGDVFSMRFEKKKHTVLVIVKNIQLPTVHGIDIIIITKEKKVIPLNLSQFLTKY